MAEGCSGNCGSCASGGDCQHTKVAECMNKIKNKYFVLSGKGGVGKSSVAALLALSLAKAGRRVGLLDVDFHGPSQPTLFGVADARLEPGDAEGSIAPLDAGGVKLVSIGLLLEDSDQAVIWRGPAKMGVLEQLLSVVEWGELDDLVLDFPPGTGDEILSACQLIPGRKRAVVVTTPQEVSLADCRKCLDFCAKLELEVAGVVENMSGFICPNCGTRHELFSQGGGEKLAAAHHVPLLAQLPLDPEFMRRCDAGTLPEELDSFPAIGEAMKHVAADLAAK
ncbi:MAG: Mrp/NBP35 family ATP-binding protein [Lentisphaeria bacterium]|nr:Mrp/NBP35 family ATP-binding protein [Lentisphaeria bacterium]